jgi:cell division protein ZapA
MGQVTVTIADKVYRIACDDGQEEHLLRLATELDGRIAEMRVSFGEIGDRRLTVMAAIAALDQREELRERVAQLERDVSTLREQGGAMVAEFDRTEAEIAAAVVEAAERIEVVARELAPLPRI